MTNKKKICRQTADSGPIKKKINNKQIKRTYLDNQAVRWRQMSKRFQVSAPLFDFGQLLRSPFHRNSLWWKWWFTSIQTAGSFWVEVLRWSVWLGASPWWIFWLQWYKNILIPMIQEYSGVFLGLPHHSDKTWHELASPVVRAQELKYVKFSWGDLYQYLLLLSRRPTYNWPLVKSKSCCYFR